MKTRLYSLGKLSVMHVNVLGLLKAQNVNFAFVLPVASICMLRMHDIYEEALNLHNLLRGNLNLLKL